MINQNGSLEHVRGFLSDGLPMPFFPYRTIPHLKGVRVCWDRNVNETTRRLKVHYENVNQEMVFTWVRHKDGGNGFDFREEFCDEGGTSYPNLGAAIRGGRATMMQSYTRLL